MKDFIEITFWRGFDKAGDKTLERSITTYVTGIVTAHLRGIVKKYKPSPYINAVILNDCIKEYTTALSVYSYTDSNLKRRRITYLLMKARGRDPNPEGSFSKADAMSWAESSTKLTNEKIAVKRNIRGRRSSKNTRFVCAFEFDISLTAKNKVLANLEYGRTSWWGETENIKRLLFYEANEGYMFNRINLKERDEIIIFADEMTDADKKGRNRPYLKMAVNTAREKYGEKWTDLIIREIEYLIHMNYNVKKARITVPSNKTHIIVKNQSKEIGDKK